MRVGIGSAFFTAVFPSFKGKCISGGGTSMWEDLRRKECDMFQKLEGEWES